MLLGDEPTGALDLETGRTVLGLLHELSHELAPDRAARHPQRLDRAHGRPRAAPARRRIAADEHNGAPEARRALEW